MNQSRRKKVVACCVATVMAFTASLHAQCASDIDESGQVDGGDIGMMLGSWGPCSAKCQADLNGDSLVDGADLAHVLSDWGLGLGEDRDADGIPDDCDDYVEVATTIFELDFEDRQVGIYTESMLDEDWNDPSWSNGIDVGRVSVVATDDRSNLALAVLYPEGEFGTSATGAQWKLDLDGSFEHVRVSYRLQFTNDFDFVRGGKLPGLIGGQGNTGGGIPTGTDGWSARMMWRTNGAITQYVYHPDQPQNYGEDFPWEADGEQAVFESDRWYSVTHKIRMNTPGENDGSIHAWIDGVLALSVEGHALP